MKRVYLPIILLLISSIVFGQSSFKDEMLRYPRVRSAYAEKESSLEKLLLSKSIHRTGFEVYLRAFKEERIIELWAKNVDDSLFARLKDYKICAVSGKPGPKRRQGDLQIPEGFYHIDRFNPHSNFLLSLGINYPNSSDLILGDKNNPGGDIFIHGACVTIGCMPITDDEIMELFIICLEAKNSGQSTIPVTIFPARPTGNKYKDLVSEYSDNLNITGLWQDLEHTYTSFEKSHSLPEIVFLENGRHKVK